MFSQSCRTRLTAYDVARFTGDTLFHRLARTVCAAGCLPRKELFEAWEVARRVRRRFRGGRVVDLCAGHGLLGQIMLLLDDTSPEALVVDEVVPPSAATVHAALAETWPRLRNRVTFRACDIQQVEIREDDVVVSSHACGRLTDLVIERATTVGARVAVLPCCHDLQICDTGALSGWLDGPLAVDVVRATRLRELGRRVWTLTIPASITPHNRLLMVDRPTPPSASR